MTNEQVQAIRAVCDAIFEAVKTAGTIGAPGGVIYSALMAHGCTLEQFQQFMAALIRAGRIEQRGNLYFAR